MKLSRARAGKPYQRANYASIRYGLEELKLLRSFGDLRIFWQKMAYLMPRAVGTIDRFEAPPSVQIEPTNHCNVNCICCPTSRSSRPRGYMDIDLFKMIINDASHIGVKRARLFLHGEPMLHPQIVEMISYTKSKGIAINLATNGMLFDKEKSEAILRSGVNYADHFTFSILGYSKEVHESIMRRGDYDKAVKNIFDFLELRRKYEVNGPVIETVFYTMAENEHEEERYVEHWRGVVDHAKLGGRISESFSEYKRETKPIAPRKQTCLVLWDRMTIFWNGDVTMCCEDVDGDWVLGNLNEHSIREIWNCEQLLAIRNIHKEKQFEKIPLCYKCDM